MSKQKAKGQPGPQIAKAKRRIAAAKVQRREELDLGALSLVDIPQEVGELSWLKRLYLGLDETTREKSHYEITEEDKKNRNAVSALPDFITELPNLEQIDLSYNQLSALPEAIGRLTALQTLSLDGNQLTALPEAIGRLTVLQTLSLDGNQLTALPEAIGRLTTLQSLWLDRNRLTRLPEAIGRLTALIGLWLDGNQLTALPETFGQLTALRTLWLDGNRLTTLPEAIGQLTNLRILSVDNNRITVLPAIIGQLVGLQSLWLRGNQLATLPEAIGKLTALRNLSLANNRITTLPTAVGQLTALESLWLDSNRLTTLPEAIGRLTALKTLSLGDNQLTTLPEAIGQLTALKNLFLDGNPLTAPPPEVVSQGASAIREFLQRVAAEGRPLYEVKVVLVGEGAVGKTTLRNWILEGKYVEPGSTTRALELRSCTLPNHIERDEPVRINVWDFGGQDEYRPSQQLFFTEGALYLLLWKGRDGLPRGRVEEWLRLIRLRAGKDARVLMVATHMSANDPLPSLGALPDDLRRMVTGPFAIDNHAGHGIKELKERITGEVCSLPGFGQKWPRSWIKARDAVLNQQTGATGGLPSFISYDRFRELCEPHDVAGDGAETLAKTLSLQGRLDYHGDGRNPSQLVILNPEWLMKAIAYVISDRAVTENKGILTRQRLAPIWRDHQRAPKENPERYEPRLWPALLELMAGHEIVYQLTKDEWVVAQLVPEEPPAEIPWTIGDGKGTIRLHCDLTDKIRGLMALLTVRNHYHHVDRHRLFWQRGAFLRQPHTKAEALVTIDGEDKIRLEVRGDHGQLMGELVGSLERLIYEMWPGAERNGEPPFKYYVPCPSPGCKGRFGRRDLIADLYDEEVDTARCEGGGRHSHDIRALLHGVGLPSQDRKLDKVLERISHVQSYISSEAPRIVAIEQVERGALNPMQLLNSKVRVRIHCEVLKEPVEDAEEILKFEKGWWGVVKRWGPFATSIVALGVPLTGVEVAPPDPGFEKAAKEGREALKKRGGDDPDVGPSFGVLVRPDGAHLPNAFKEKLIAIAKKGGMTQVQMDSDGRWVWVCQEVAERNDRSIAKEPPKSAKGRGGRRAS